jgi:hypothetical protein
MTDSEINKIIAEYIQWKPAIIPRDMTGKPFEGWDIPPDYCNNLNEMHEAEKMLTAEQARSYDKELQKIGFRNRLAGAFWLWHFSAGWKAEAFLKTIGKWKD